MKAIEKDGAEATIYIEIPNVYPSVEIMCNEESVIRYFMNMFRPYAFEGVTQKNAARFRFYYDGQGALMVEHVHKGKCFHIKSAIRHIEDFLLKKATLEKDYLMLHGAAVEKDGYAVLFLAPSETGKSTLVSYLCNKGFRYITDERILIDTKTKEVLPFPKTIMLREGGFNILAKRYQLDINTELFTYEDIRRYFWNPRNECHSPAKILRICVLNRSENRGFTISDIPYEMRLDNILANSMICQNRPIIEAYLSACLIPMSQVCYSNVEPWVEYLEDLMTNAE